MKIILTSRTVPIPDNGKRNMVVNITGVCTCKFSVVTVTAKKRVVTVKGPRGTLSKSFRHIQCELTMLSKRKIRVDLWFANRKQLATLRTVCSHIENLIKGVLYVSIFDAVTSTL